MAADEVLEFDVITVDGQHEIVNACQNKDLFWALRGGGGGSFALVISPVLRTFPSPSIVSVLYSISTTNERRYARFIRDFIRFIPTLADAGCAGYFYMRNTNISSIFFVPNGNFTVTTAIFNQLINNNTDLELINNSINSGWRIALLHMGISQEWNVNTSVAD